VYANGNNLLPYQVEGRNFLVAPNPGSLKNHKYLCWHPGTGKSCIICAALVDSHVETLLLICPVRIKRTWAKHLVNWGVVDNVDDIHIVWQTDEIIPITKRVIIISYELLLSPTIQKQLKGKTYDAIVVDEAHRAKTLTSKRSNILFGKDALIGYGRLKWLASGTPMPNGSANEMYPAISALYPECIDRCDYETFLLRFCGAWQTFNGYGTELHLGTDSDIQGLREKFKGFVSFKTIEEVAKDLPPVVEKLVYIDIGRIGADQHDTPISTLARLTGEAKIPQVAEYVSDWLKQHNGERLIVFAYHREVILQLYALIGEQEPETSYLFGGQSDSLKQSILKNFCRKENYTRCLILQINAAGEAIDGLQRVANHIIQAEPDWSPGVGNQAIGRLYRIGQTKPTYVTTIVAENTLDETKVFKYDRKQGIIDQYFAYEADQNYTTKEQTMPTTEQWDDIIDLADRLVSIIERTYEGNGTTETKPKQTRQRKPKDAVPTTDAPPPVAPSAPPAVQQNATAQPQPQPMQTDFPKSFQEVIDCAKAAKARITQQFVTAHNIDGAEAEQKAIALISADVIKPLGYENLPQAETDTPQRWVLIMQQLASKQYVPNGVPQTANVGF